MGSHTIMSSKVTPPGHSECFGSGSAYLRAQKPCSLEKFEKLQSMVEFRESNLGIDILEKSGLNNRVVINLWSSLLSGN